MLKHRSLKWKDLRTFGLRNALIDEITQYGPITDAMEDPLIDEIRANGPQQIFVEKKGRTEIWDKCLPTGSIWKE